MLILLQKVRRRNETRPVNDLDWVLGAGVVCIR
jgi:hypothetical protein